MFYCAHLLLGAINLNLRVTEKNVVNKYWFITERYIAISRIKKVRRLIFGLSLYISLIWGNIKEKLVKMLRPSSKS